MGREYGYDLRRTVFTMKLQCSSSQVVLTEYLFVMCDCSKDGKCYSMIESTSFHQPSDKCQRPIQNALCMF